MKIVIKKAVLTFLLANKLVKHISNLSKKDDQKTNGFSKNE